MNAYSLCSIEAAGLLFFRVLTKRSCAWFSRACSSGGKAFFLKVSTAASIWLIVSQSPCRTYTCSVSAMGVPLSSSRTRRTRGMGTLLAIRLQRLYPIPEFWRARKVFALHPVLLSGKGFHQARYQARQLGIDGHERLDALAGIDNGGM